MELRRAENRTARKNAAVRRLAAKLLYQSALKLRAARGASLLSSLPAPLSPMRIDWWRNVVFAHRIRARRKKRLNFSLAWHTTMRAETSTPLSLSLIPWLSRLMRRRSTSTWSRKLYKLRRAETSKRFFHCQCWHRRPPTKLLKDSEEREEIVLTN